MDDEPQVEFRVVGRTADVPGSRRCSPVCPPSGSPSGWTYVSLPDLVARDPLRPICCCSVIARPRRAASPSSRSVPASRSSPPAWGRSPRCSRSRRAGSSSPATSTTRSGGRTACSGRWRATGRRCAPPRWRSPTGAELGRDGRRGPGADGADGAGMSDGTPRAVGLVVTSSVYGGAEKYLLDLYGAPSVRREFTGPCSARCPRWDQLSLARTPDRPGSQVESRQHGPQPRGGPLVPSSSAGGSSTRSAAMRIRRSSTCSTSASRCSSPTSPLAARARSVDRAGNAAALPAMEGRRAPLPPRGR